MKNGPLLATGVAALSMMLVTPASAWDGDKTGKITQIEVSAGTSYGFRIRLDGSGAMCASHAWAYMNITWDNYDAAASLLISAWLAGKTVRIYSNLTNGYCEIGHITTY